MLDPTNPYYRQVALLLDMLPLVAKEDCFALKGGTGINLFLRDLPRLSVDIDLAYLPVRDRAISPSAIGSALEKVAAVAEGRLRGVRIQRRKVDGQVIKLFVARGGVQVKMKYRRCCAGPCASRCCAVLPRQWRRSSARLRCWCCMHTTLRRQAVRRAGPAASARSV
jgi:hypothetical protein